MSGEVKAVLALSLGRVGSVDAPSWSNVFAIAERERCAALAWMRSSQQIRRMAPPDVVSRWRAAALAAVDVANLWEGILAGVIDTLRAVGVESIVLKGLPLGEMLYGNVAARPCADVDLFIPCEQRAAAHRALLDSGWRWRLGVAPREAAYEGAHEGRTVLLEVHSSLLDDPIVSHLAFRAPRGRVVQVGKVGMLAHDDDQLPGFLAAHLAKHAMPPILWLIDFDRLWSKLDQPGRDRAWAAARAARAHRYLEWALQRSELLRAAADGSDDACAALGFREGRRTDGHNATRVALLAATPADALRVFAAWSVPRDLLGGRRELVLRLAQRLRKSARGALGSARVYGDAAPPSPTGGQSTRAISLDGSDLAAVARELGEKGASFWIRATGSSMKPSIPGGALIRLTSPANRTLRNGDVVLADLGGGSCVLHRVRRLSGQDVHLQGDANLRADRPVTRADVLAIADAVRTGGSVRTIPAARISRARNTLRAWRLRLFAGTTRRGTGSASGAGGVQRA